MMETREGRPVGDGTDVPGTGSIRARLGLPEGASEEMLQGGLVVWEKLKANFPSRAERERRRDAPLDTGEMPNFDALRRWIDKLEHWCSVNLSEGQADAKTILELQSERDKLKEKVEGLEGEALEVESIEDIVRDIERGVRSIEELYDHMGVTQHDSAYQGLR